MMPNELKHAGLTDENRKELIEYYKWIVNLAIFVLTVSLALSGLFPGGLHHSWLLISGWVFLGFCIFFNWLIIKRLVAIPIVFSSKEQNRNWLHAVFIGSMANLQKYALVQNWCFLLGTLAIALGYALNVFRK